MDSFMYFPLILTVVGYIIILLKQYLVYDVKVVFFAFWVSQTVQALADYLNIYYSVTSTFNEVLAGSVAFYSVLCVSLVLLYKIMKQESKLGTLLKNSDPFDKFAIVIFLIYAIVFIVLESDDPQVEWMMAIIAIALDLVGLIIFRKEIYTDPDQQTIQPWVCWIFALSIFCFFEALLNYSGVEFLFSIGWIMLCENLIFVCIISYWIYDAKKSWT